MAAHHGFTPEETLRAYNWGPGNVLKYRKGARKDIPDEALNYPGKILGIENTEGVAPPPGEEPPLPTTRPDSIAGEEQALPTPRPEQSEGDGVMDFLKKYVLGAKYQMTGGPVPQYREFGGSIFDQLVPGQTNIDQGVDPVIPSSNVVPGFEGQDPSKMSPIRKKAYEKALAQQQNNNIPVATPETINRNNPEVPVVGAPSISNDEEDGFDLGSWAAKNILGPKAKENLGVELEEEDKEFLDKKTAESERLAGPQIAEEENQIADGYVPTEEDVIKAEVKNVAETSPEAKEELKTKVLNKVDTDTIDAPKVEAEDKDVEAAAKKDPGMVEKAGGFLKGILGDLFDEKELKRAAIMYAGSRLLGYNHQGSLRHSLKNYVGRVDQKVTNRQEFVKTNAKNFTPASLQQYKETGDLSVLQKLGSPVTASGQYKTFYGPGGKAD